MKRWRPVWPPASISTICPVRTTGMLAVPRKPPREVTRSFVFTPFSTAGFASWASADGVTGVPYWALAPPTMTPKPTAAPTRTLSLMDTPPIISWFTASLDRRAGDARDELVQEEVVHDGHRHADQQRPRHQRAPEIDVAPNQLGGHPEGHRLLVRDGDERQRVEKVL